MISPSHIKIPTALIGVGYWGSKLKRYIEDSPHFSLKYTCDSKSNLQEVWDDEEVQAVIIATPNYTHASLSKQALLSSKHVMVEKPLALHYNECINLCSISKESNKILLTEYTYTFSRALAKAKQLIDKIGCLHGLEMSTRHLGRFHGGSVYWLLGSHMLSVLDIFIPLDTLKFTATPLVQYEWGTETGVITFTNNDITGQLVVSLNYPGKETKIIFYGDMGTMIYNPTSSPELQITTYERVKWTVMNKLPKQTKSYSIDESNNLRCALEYFYDCINGQAEDNVRRATQITKILEEIQHE